MLQIIFKQLLQSYTSNEQEVQLLWSEVEVSHSAPHRYYHTLTHLEHMHQQLVPCKNWIDDWDTILFSLFYHDIIYDPLQSDNEEQSAALAVQRLQALSYPELKIARCQEQILATNKHKQQADTDANYFIDADLSVLGSNWNTYAQYAANVRKEYAVYPDSVYKPGRYQVLQHFLQMERIYKTPYFLECFEIQARQNLRRELQQLG